MSKKISLGAAVMMMAVTAAVAVTVTMLYAMRLFNVNLANYAQRITIYNKLAKVDELVRSKYIGTISNSTLSDDLLQGYVEGLGDPHADYYDAATYAQTQLGLSGQGVGIGVGIAQYGNSAVRVDSVSDNSPAKAAGVQSGDLIVKIAGKNVSDLGYDNAVTMLRGKEGTAAEFIVSRGGTQIPFSIVRRQYEVQNVHLRMIGNTAVIKIDEFDENAASQFETALGDAVKNGALSYVFDLRNNPGGEVKTAADILNRLLPAGPIVRVRYKGQASKVLFSAQGKNELKAPMAVLVNSGTASAAELFAAALRDYGKAKLVGVKTYGKGTMQQYYELSDGSAVKFSVAYFDPPKSANFDGKGLEPDVTATLSPEKLSRFYELSDAEDDQLQAALTYLSSISS